MRSKEFYLIIFFLLLSIRLSASELSAKMSCYEEFGKVTNDKGLTRFFINYGSSSQKTFEIVNQRDIKGDSKNLSRYNAKVKFKVVKDCDFQCDAQIFAIEILPPWEKIDPVIKIARCK